MPVGMPAAANSSAVRGFAARKSRFPGRPGKLFFAPNGKLSGATLRRRTNRANAVAPPSEFRAVLF
jgi:hypothetical protein